MPRTPGIRYFTSRKAYYTQYRGKQHLLAAGPKDEPDGPTYKAASKSYAALLDAGNVGKGDAGAAMAAIITRYYFSLEREGRKNTLHLARTMLDPAIEEFGHLRVKELKPYVVNDWLARQTTWNDSTQNTAVCVLSRALSWAKEQGLIAGNPIAGMAKPEKRVRGKEMILPEPLQEVLIEAANRELGKFLRMLRGTGARPGEIIHADVKHYRREIGAIIFPWNPAPGEYRWKTAKKTKRDRVIYLTPDLAELVEKEIAARGGSGRIFQTVRGRDWNNNNLTNCMIKMPRRKRVKEWCEKNNFDATKIMPYSFRHSYITRMLMAGCPIKLIADLCGTSVKMIEETYSHAHDDLQAMRRLFLQFSASAGETLSGPLPPSHGGDKP